MIPRSLLEPRKLVSTNKSTFTVIYKTQKYTSEQFTVII